MTPLILYRLKFPVLLALTIFMYSQSFGQLKRKNIIAEARALARKSEANVVVINTSVMGDIMAKCIQAGVGEVQLVFARLKPKDVSEYIENHPDAKGYEKELVGKMTVMIKIEGNITEDTFADNSSNTNALNSFITRAGLVQVNRPYGDLPILRGVVYLEVGKICPPPTSCN